MYECVYSLCDGLLRWCVLHLIALLAQDVQYTVIPQEMTCSTQESSSSHVKQESFQVGVCKY